MKEKWGCEKCDFSLEVDPSQPELITCRGNNPPCGLHRVVSRAEQISPERGRTHGDFKANADIAQSLRGKFRSVAGWDQMETAQKLALDEIALKLARILSARVHGSDASQKEHWDDIIGYATLGGSYCAK